MTVYLEGAVRVVGIPSGALLACYRNRSPIALGAGNNMFDDKSFLDRIDVNGPWIAWVRRVSGGHDRGVEVKVCNLSEHRGISEGALTTGARRVTALAVNDNGAAWAVQARQPANDYISVADADGSRIVAMGDQLDVNSLGMAATGAYWTSAGAPVFQRLSGGAGPSWFTCKPVRRPDLL